MAKKLTPKRVSGLVVKTLTLGISREGVEVEEEGEGEGEEKEEEGEEEEEEEGEEKEGWWSAVDRSWKSK